MMDDDSAQTALIDSLIFMALMLLATAIIISSGSVPRVSESAGQQYVNDFSSTLLAIEVEGRTMAQMVLEEMIIQEDNITSQVRVEILQLGDELIKNGWRYAISCEDYFISSYCEGLDHLPKDRFASTFRFQIDNTSVEIVVYVWEA